PNRRRRLTPWLKTVSPERRSLLRVGGCGPLEGPCRFGCRDDEIDARVDGEHRRIHHELVQRGIRRVDAVQLADVASAGVVGLLETGAGSVEINAFPRRAASRATLGWAVEPNVEDPGASAERDGCGAPEHHGTA